jgi:hypothetical protein
MNFLTSPFTEKEIRDAIFDMEQRKHLALILSRLIYQKFWEIIKSDLMQMFQGFAIFLV